MRISPFSALLLLYRYYHDNRPHLGEIEPLLVCGIRTTEDQRLFHHLANDEALKGYEIDRISSMDIDDKEDLEIVSRYFK